VIRLCSAMLTHGSGYRSSSSGPKTEIEKGHIDIPMWDYPYLGSSQMYRESAADGSTTTLEGETLEIMTDGKRVSPYESRTGGALPYPSFRYELDNLICSAALKLDDQVQIISHEK